MLTIARMLIQLFGHLPANFGPEIEAVRRQYPSEPFPCTEEPLVLQSVIWEIIQIYLGINSY